MCSVLCLHTPLHLEGLNEAQLEEGATSFLVAAAHILAVWALAVEARVLAPTGLRSVTLGSFSIDVLEAWRSSFVGI